MMYVLWVCHDGAIQHPSIHLIDEAGDLAHSAPTVELALRWLWGRGEEQVVAITDDGPELFLIERCGCPTMTLPAVSMRRAHLGSCLDPPKLLGLGDDPNLRARGLDARPETPLETRRRHFKWLRRAAGP